MIKGWLLSQVFCVIAVILLVPTLLIRFENQDIYENCQFRLPFIHLIIIIIVKDVSVNFDSEQ